LIKVSFLPRTPLRKKETSQTENQIKKNLAKALGAASKYIQNPIGSANKYTLEE
jgi:hypothetical protein